MEVGGGTPANSDPPVCISSLLINLGRKVLELLHASSNGDNQLVSHLVSQARRQP